MFSNRGEEQFAPHETMAVEHFAEIFFAPGGFTKERRRVMNLKPRRNALSLIFFSRGVEL
jgi:hypothetical protein